MTREAIIKILRNSEATITFLKKDGTKRKMFCTLNPDILPPLKGSNHACNEEVLPVWDLEKNAWRSFRLDSIIKIGD